MKTDAESNKIRRLDIQTWKRREHFEFFRHFEQPFFNVCTEVDVTALVEQTSETGRSFFLASLYLSLKAANEIEEFRLRIRGDEVLCHPLISAGSTVLRSDETFGFGYFDHSENFDQFETNGKAVLAAEAHPAPLRPHIGRDDLIYYSILPWISFTSFAHANRNPATDCIPRIVFGKHSRQADKRCMLPISIEVHHALVDGLHVGRFLERFQELLQQPV